MQRGKTQSLWWRVISRNVWYDEFAESTLQLSRNQHAATSQQRLVMVCTHVWTLLWQNPCIQTYPFYGRGIFSLNFGYKNSCKKDVFFFRIIFLSPVIQSAWLVASWASQNSCWIFAYPKENLMHKTLLYQKTVGFLCLCFFHCYSVFVGIILWSFVLCCFRPSQKVVCVKRPFKASELLKLARMPIQHYWCPSSGLNCMMQVIIWMLRWTIQTRSADGNCNRFWCRLLPCLQNIVRMIS